MNVASILKSKGTSVVTVSPSETLKEAADTLSIRKIGAVIVVDGHEVLGILSERDIVNAISNAGGSALNAPVGRFMTERVVICGLDDTIDQLMDAMTGGRFRHIPVVEDGRLCGIISIGDVVKHRLAETEFEAEALRLYIATG